MDEKQQLALLGKCRSIKTNTLCVLDNFDKYYSAYVESVYDREKDLLQVSFISSDTERTLHSHLQHMQHEVNGILSSFVSMIDKAKELGIDIKPPQQKISVEGLCRKMIIDCDSVIATIEYSLSPLSPKQKNVLEKLQKNINILCKNLDANFEKNFNNAIKNLNDDDALGSSLITARILDYMLSQLDSNNNIEGNNITEKMKTLSDNKIIDTDIDILTTLIIKAQKKVRNALDHTISYSPDTSESISLLGDCVSVLKIYAKAINYSESP
jgi:hypothetical protein